MKEIQLTQGYVALVDDEDFERVSQFNWYVQINKNNIYAFTKKMIKRVVTKYYLHRFIMKIDKEDRNTIDHINHYGLDCQKHNMRKCTQSQNLMNMTGRKNSSSSYKGVGYVKRAKKWRARVRINSTEHYLGYFNNEMEAAKAYDLKAKELFGEFALLNFK